MKNKIRGFNQNINIAAGQIGQTIVKPINAITVFAVRLMNLSPGQTAAKGIIKAAIKPKIRRNIAPRRSQIIFFCCLFLIIRMLVIIWHKRQKAP
ncbi:MAG: hypothetical protein ACP5OG_03055 [Candidatus Nanoarchaeia archaeon]